MKMNTQPIINLQVSLEELVGAFKELPANADNQLEHYSVKFPVTDDYGHPGERELLFSWNVEANDWELNAKGHDLLITSANR